MNTVTSNALPKGTVIVPKIELVLVPPGTVSIRNFGAQLGKDLVLHELAREVIAAEGNALPAFSVQTSIHFIGGVDARMWSHPALILNFVFGVDSLDRVCSRSARWTISFGHDSSAQSKTPWRGETHYIAITP